MTAPAPGAVLGRRRAGVLLHATSLPDAAHGALGPVGADRSPYYARSNHAGDPGLVDLALLAEWGLVDRADLGRLPRPTLLARATAALGAGSAAEAPAFAAFQAQAVGWLPDYALFVALQAEQGERPWWQWPTALRERAPAALDAARERLRSAIALVAAEQFCFHAQYRALRGYAAANGVCLFGDIPIYVAPDSVEVWAHPELFELAPGGEPAAVAGVPPDYFAKDGQRWGNPLYRWEAHERQGFAWWLARLEAQFALFDLVRIDHFRGLESYWAVPADASTAARGEWRPAPGRQLLEHARARFGRLDVVAEDLGVITPAVEALRADFALPGMRVLQFGFDGDPGNVHLPHHWRPQQVAYTGTHDNDTTAGWYAALEPALRARVDDYLGGAGRAPAALVRTVLASVADLAVLPMQDLLGLGSAARMNTPGTTVGNWQWRFDWADVPPGLAAACRHQNGVYGRL